VELGGWLCNAAHFCFRTEGTFYLGSGIGEMGKLGLYHKREDDRARSVGAKATLENRFYGQRINRADGRAHDGPAQGARLENVRFFTGNEVERGVLLRRTLHTFDDWVCFVSCIISRELDRLFSQDSFSMV